MQDDLRRRRELAEARHPWVTIAIIAACVAVYLGYLVAGRPTLVVDVRRFGVLPASEIRGGAVWGLVTPVFVHFNAIHLYFNMNAIWVLGTRLERSIGSPAYLVLYVVSGALAATFQLAVSDTTGIGASGAAFALIGFMWIVRDRYPLLRDVMHARTMRLVSIWLVGCVVVSWLGVLPIANTAHFSGLAFGAALAGALFAPRLRTLWAACVSALVALAVVVTLWAPWSVTWLWERALEAHVAGRSAEAIEYYDRLLERDPEVVEAYHNRGLLRLEAGDAQAGHSDLERARALEQASGSRASDDR